MDCGRIDREDKIDAYLGGRLSADERAILERHLFECPHCLEELRSLRAVQAELWEQGSPAGSVASQEYPVRTRRWAFASAAALALVMIGAALWWKLGRLPGGATVGGAPSTLVALAEFEAPAYLPLNLRGGTDDAAERFRAGMELYQSGRYDLAIRELRAAAAADSQASSTSFFLGICYLLTGRTNKGIARLEGTVSLGDPAYLTEARFYLAKGWLRKGNTDKARVELETVAKSGSRLAEEAARLLEQIAKSPSR